MGNLPCWGGVRLILGRVQANVPKGSAGIKLSQTRFQRMADLYRVGMSRPPAKVVLSNRYRYLREIRSVSQLHDRISGVSSIWLNETQLRKDIERTIINKTLKQSLLTHLEQDHRIAILQELEDYYHLSPGYIPTFRAFTLPAETFARNALSYLQKHPHKPNWPLRHILKAEGIDPALKQAIRKLIEQDKIPAEQTDQALKLFQAVYEQYNHLLKQSTQDPEVQLTVEIYKNLAEELEQFTQENNRPPKFQAESEYERDLFNVVAVLAYHHETNCFEQVIPYINRVYEILEKFPSPKFTEEVTLQELKKFITTHHTFPQSVHLRDILNPRPSEDMLYESILYWKQHSPSFQKEVDALIPIQQKSYPPSFHYYY